MTVAVHHSTGTVDLICGCVAVFECGLVMCVCVGGGLHEVLHEVKMCWWVLM